MIRAPTPYPRIKIVGKAASDPLKKPRSRNGCGERYNISYFILAWIRPWNNGCGLVGLDWNSGWNCTATKYG